MTSSPLDDDSFDLVIGDGSLIHSERIPEMLAEMVRVAAPGATVALTLPTFSSFGEFFSIYWEALHNCGLIDHESDVENLITVLPIVSAVEELAEQSGLEELSSVTRIEEFDFDSAEKFLRCSVDCRFPHADLDGNAAAGITRTGEAGTRKIDRRGEPRAGVCVNG